MTTTAPPRVVIRRPADFEPLPAQLRESTIVACFERIADGYPQNIAVTDSDHALTYRELNGRANALAELLRAELGDSKEPIALLLDHGHRGVVSLLGVLKTGRPYLPLDVGYPAERISKILRQAQPPALVTERSQLSLASSALENHPRTRLWNLDVLELPEVAANPKVRAEPGDMAAIMYTSGTSGEAKGVIKTHANTTSFIFDLISDWFISPSDRVTTFGAISFAASRSTLFMPLFTGAATCLLDLRLSAAGSSNAIRWLQDQHVSVLTCPAGLFQALFARLPAGQRFPRIRLIVVAGQAVGRAQVELYREHSVDGCVFTNAYYTTECDGITRYYIDQHTALEGDVVPVGHAWPDRHVSLLDNAGRPVAAGERGQIAVRGRNLSPGYFHQPELTSARFRSAPEDAGQRIYLTGDSGRFNAEGALELLGREDSQVKIRGFRVEISEVERALLSQPGVRNAAVVAKPAPDRAGSPRLMAYLVADSEPVPAPGEIRQRLRTALPDYMIPTAFVFMEALPLTSRGKIDLGALPEPPEPPALKESDLPASPIESEITQIWRAALGIQRIGVKDDFFELGGDSLSVLSMMLDVEEALGQPVPRAFFRSPTIRGLAALLASPQPAPAEMPASFRPEAGVAPVASGSRGLLAARERLRRAAQAVRRTADATYVFEWALSQYVRRLPFDEALGLAQRISTRPVLLRTAYAGKRALFRRFLRALRHHESDFASLFADAVANNLLFELVDERRPFSDDHRSRYFTERTGLMARIDLQGLDRRFPVSGLDHLKAARARGSGVILLSYHGAAGGRIAKHMLGRRLGNVPIRTVAHNLAAEASSYRGARGLMPAAVAGSLYGELAYYGQALLKDGHIVEVLGDTYAPGPGRTCSLQIGDRAYVIKPGFAELAINTGATVIPFTGRYDERGALLLELLPPFEQPRGTREEQVAALVRQYEAFINRTMRLHPEMLSWRRMTAHLRHPRTGDTHAARIPSPDLEDE